MESDSSSSTSSSSSSSSPASPRCKKRKQATDCEPVLTVAAIRHALSPQSSVSLLLTHLRHLLSLLHSSPAPPSALCDAGLLQLLPPLLSHSSSKVAKKSAEVAGLLAISSYEVSCCVAEKGILRALAQLLYRASADVLLVAIHAVLNVATCDSGRAALREVTGLEHQLMRIVSFLAEMLTKEHKVSDTKGDHDLTFLLNIPLDEATELFDLSLAAVNTLFHGLVENSDLLLTLQTLWRIIDGDFHTVGEFLWTPNRRSHLAKLIMRLAMQSSSLQVDANPVRIFGEDFFQRHWELSPMHEKLPLPGFLEKIAASSPTRMLELLVDGMVACPPAVADELDMSVLYRDMEQELGLLPVCNQDIRLLQCKAGTEILYPLGSSVTSRDCVNAYTSGNTVVIRGLQFRWPEVAAVCSALAVELGQVTVGANLYLTPPGAQGLGVHFDDHCVFVCQLRGQKRWDVYPPLELLPHLYSFRKMFSELVNKDCATRYDLQEGDVLYIPRGFLHEARTEDNVKSNTSEWHGASLHLSFGVEVEPAFEWEGLLHIALRLWSHNNTCNTDEVNCEPLLHVAIRNAGTDSHLFRKACILRQNPDHMFRLMLKEVRESADFHTAVEDFQKEGLARLDWLRHLSVGQLNYSAFDTSIAALEGMFQSVLHRFCEGASLRESIEAQDVLLSKFRKSRQKVLHGLLALHCRCWM